MANFKTLVVIGLVMLSQSVCSQIFSKENKPMKQFSLLVRVPETYTSEQAKAVYPEWEALLENWKNSGVYVISFAFPGESYTITGAKKEVKEETVLSNNLKVVSNLVVQVENREQALELSKSIPILVYGGSVEVREIPNPIVLCP